MIKVRDIRVADNKNQPQNIDRTKQSTTVQQRTKFTVMHVPAVKTGPMPMFGTIKNIKAVPKAPNPPSQSEKEDVYRQRKMMLTECRELFTALMKLPDKELQQKLLKVINEHKTVARRSIQTQTEPYERELTLREKQQRSYITQTLVPTQAPSTTSGDQIINKNFPTHNDNHPTVANKKRKRKRIVSLPQANKESRFARHTPKQNVPFMISKKNYKVATHHPSSNCNENSAKRQRVNSVVSECGTEIMYSMEDTELISTQINSKKDMLLNLVKDIFLADIESMETGLLPIQETITKNQINNLTRQIYIWKDYKKVDLNELVTDEGEDLLHLAVLNTCDPSIMQLLLDKGLNVNCLDSESNTIIHLAIKNDIDVLSFEHLVKRIDLKLLISLNDEGYSPLHLAVRQDRYLLAERLINIIDERLVEQVHYKRHIDNLETDEKVLKKQFKEFYEKICLGMDTEEDRVCLINNHDLKEKLLQGGDSRSGNSSLYFAIENKSEHLIYFLLAHLADPRTENLSGLDCKSYFNEYGKTLNLSLNIDNAMEKVIKILS